VAPDEARTIAKVAAREAVKEMLVSLGIDPEDHPGTQRDMAFLRNWRESTETVKRQSIITAVAIFMAGLLGLIWLALKG
jgi:hypothetical protein